MKQIVVMPGGFHPFHAGHYALYQSAVKAFPDADVYVAATADTSSRPFPFKVKEKLARLAGVPANRFIQVKSPFRAEEITAKYDPEDTVLIFVRSDKDKNSQPRPGGVKKDGSPAYLQPLDDDPLPMNQHGYMVYLPTVEFGSGMTSASEIRNSWPSLTDSEKLKLVSVLYPKIQKNKKLADTVIKILDATILDQLTENKFSRNLYFVVPNEHTDAAKKIQQVFAFYPTQMQNIWKYSIMRNENPRNQEKKLELLTKVFGQPVKISAQGSVINEIQPTVISNKTYQELQSSFGRLQQAIKKVQELDKLSAQLEKLGLLTPGLRADADVSAYVADAAKDDYQTLNILLDRGLQNLKNRLYTHRVAYSQPSFKEDFVDEAGCKN